MEFTPHQVQQTEFTLEEALRIVAELPESTIVPFKLYPEFQEGEINMVQGKDGKQRRKSVAWSAIEQEFLLNGFRRLGTTWTQILKEYPFHPIRGRCDLKDKWNNINRHSNEPNLQAFFHEIEECVRLRTEMFQQSFPTGKGAESHGDDPTYQLLPQYKEIIPRRHQSLVCELLENPKTKEQIEQKLHDVIQRPETLFTFLDEARKLRDTLNQPQQPTE